MHERIIKKYFDGWVKKEWTLVAGQLAGGFTFSRAAPDDHIPIEKFKEKCWPQSAYIQKFEFIKIMGNSNEAFAIIHVVTTDNRVIRNTEYFKHTGYVTFPYEAVFLLSAYRSSRLSLSSVWPWHVRTGFSDGIGMPGARPGSAMVKILPVLWNFFVLWIVSKALEVNSTK